MITFLLLSTLGGIPDSGVGETTPVVPVVVAVANDEAGSDIAPRKDGGVLKVAGSTREKTAAKNAPSEAEKIAGLQRSITADEKQLAELKASQDDPESEYAQAEAEFKKLDAQFQDLEKEIKKIGATGKPEEIQKLEADRKTLEKSWKLSKDRFDLSIEERKTLKQKITSIEEKLAQEQAALASLTGDVKEPPKAEATPAAGEPSTATPTPMRPPRLPWS